MKIVSLVFHPLLMVTYLSAIFLFNAPELFPRIQPQITTKFLLIVSLMTGIMPAFSVFLLRTFRYVSNLELTRRNERIAPFIFILFYYALAAYLFYVKLDMGIFFVGIMTSSALLIFLLLIITFFFKISIHSAASWGCAGYATGILFTHGISIGWMYYAIILAAGLTSTSRIYLEYHTPKEVWYGSVIGFAFGLFTMLALF